MSDEAAAHRRWHDERLARLCAADGWLTLIDLIWLDVGEYRVGSGADCHARLPLGPACWGTLRLTADTVTWQAADAQSPQPLASDRQGAPDIVHHGDLSFFLIEREGARGLRLRNQRAATRLDFAGIALYPYAPHWRLAATWDGVVAHFTIAGRPCRLHPQDARAATWQFVFADATSGRETYGGGRFLYAEPAQDGRLTLDFNRAINPPCAFTPFAVCPLPPPQNRLPVAVWAGEQRYAPHG